MRDTPQNARKKKVSSVVGPKMMHGEHYLFVASGRKMLEVQIRCQPTERVVREPAFAHWEDEMKQSAARYP